MTKEDLITIVSKKLKLIRVESDYTQLRMAEVLGLSKKTLVQIEKERVEANWTTVIAICALFRNSEVLQSSLSSEPLEIIETVAHHNVVRPKEKTLGGKVWWKEIRSEGRFRLQQNVVSHHYRVIDEQNYRWFSSFDQEEASEYLNEISKVGIME